MKMFSKDFNYFTPRLRYKCTKDYLINELRLKYKNNPYRYFRRVTNNNVINYFNNLSPTDTQKTVIKYLYDLLMFGSIAFEAPCGTGKTIAGCYVMSLVSKRTLIISSKCAVNSQWMKTIKQIDSSIPITDLSMKTQYSKNNCVYITTPQFITNNTNKHKISKLIYDLKIDLIICDEIHTIITEGGVWNECFKIFSNVNKFYTNNNESCGLLMISFSATFPIKLSSSSICRKLFGKPIEPEPFIIDKFTFDINELMNYPFTFTDIYKSNMPTMQQLFIRTPVQIIDMTNADKSIKYNSIWFRDIVWSIIQLEECYKRGLMNNEKISGIVMCRFVDSTLWMGLFISVYYNIPVVIIRSNSDKNMYIRCPNTEIFVDETFDECVNTKNKIENGELNNKLNDEPNDKPNDGQNDGQLTEVFKYIFKYLDKHYQNNKPMKYATKFATKFYDKIDKVVDNLYKPFDESYTQKIVIGTISKLKEGFSQENIVYGCCSLFSWSLLERVQIAGRVKRISKDSYISNFERVLFVCHAKVPRYLDGKIKYRFDLQNKLFDKHTLKYEMYQKCTKSVSNKMGLNIH